MIARIWCSAVLGSRLKRNMAISSVQDPPRLRRRGGEDEGRDLGLEVAAVVSLHPVGAVHGALGGLEDAAGGVLEALAGIQRRLLADDAPPADFLDAAVAVGDDPVSAAQLHPSRSFVADHHGIREHVAALLGGGA